MKMKWVFGIEIFRIIQETMELIDKDKVVAEIKRRRKEIPKEETDKALKAVYGNEAFVLTDLLSFLDSLETKDVDLEKEIISQIRLLSGVHSFHDGKQWWKGTYNELSYFAKYFFELGLKAQKGE